MEAVLYISRWTNWLFLIIPAAAGLRVTYLSSRKSLSDNDGYISDLNVKIKNTIIGSIIGVSISGIVSLVRVFYGG